MKTTTQIIQYILIQYYLDLATDSKYNYQQIINKSDIGEEVKAGDLLFNYTERSYESTFEIKERIKKYFPVLPEKEHQHLYKKSFTFFEEFDRSVGTIEAFYLLDIVQTYAVKTFLENSFLYDVSLWDNEDGEEFS